MFGKKLKGAWMKVAHGSGKDAKAGLGGEKNTAVEGPNTADVELIPPNVDEGDEDSEVIGWREALITREVAHTETIDDTNIEDAEGDNSYSWATSGLEQSS